MLAIDTSGVDAYCRWLDEQAVALRNEVRETFRAWAVAIHEEITRLTPQWSGNLAANWALDVGTKTYSAQYFVGPSSDQPFAKGGRGGGPLYARGMDPAVQISLDRAKSARLPLLSEPLFIHNPVEYADAIETDTSDPPVRAINRYPLGASGKVAMVSHAYFKHTLDGQALLNELRSRSK